MFIKTNFCAKINFSLIHYYFIQILFISTLFTGSSVTFYNPIWIFLTFYHFLLLWNMQTGYSECGSSIVLGVLWLDWLFSDTKQLCKFFICFLNKNICRSMYKFSLTLKIFIMISVCLQGVFSTHNIDMCILIL